uniref:Uncharacterized protein n=1 Tax=Podoviridae sp. ctG4L18 TaxID=2825234 RepID=A0A8S5UNR3_9CAUD|nr:MAG TPA: hypothetical protein [Caudoviricetes sp.]DAF96129.1 MAG TPA: hypothetical protein [Podoviridae sp. ctG4L18]DAM05078.1 MAG TPA: hypothetical protein [Caudoviricetes sp.]
MRQSYRRLRMMLLMNARNLRQRQLSKIGFRERSDHEVRQQDILAEV